MIKPVVILNGEIYHVGEWDYGYYKDEEGNEIVGNDTMSRNRTN